MRVRMKWQVADAKGRLSELIRATANEPQLILNRDRVVAAVVDPETFADYEKWKEQQQRSSLADAFTELRAICEEEGYELIIPPREDRPNAFADALDNSDL